MKNMRKQECQMSHEETMEVLRRGAYGILSTVDAEGQPYGIALNYVVMDNNIYLHGNKQGHKLENIAENNRVCFTVTGKYEAVPSAFTVNYESVVAFGKAYVITDDSERLSVMRELAKKECAEYMDKFDSIAAQYMKLCAVVMVDIQHITGKRKS